MSITFSVDHNDPESRKTIDGFEIVVYATNQCDDSLSSALNTITKSQLWLDESQDVNICIRVKLKEVFNTLYDSQKHGLSECVVPDSWGDFESLRNDCLWIVEQINQLKVSE